MPRSWSEARQRAVDEQRAVVERTLQEMAAAFWGRGGWRLVADPARAAWRTYRYLGTADDGNHLYQEVGVTLMIDEDGETRGYLVDDRRRFLTVTGPDTYTLGRAVRELHRESPPPIPYPEPVYDHPRHPFARPQERRALLNVLRSLLGR